MVWGLIVLKIMKLILIFVDMMENEHNKENNEEQQSVKKKVQDTSNKKRTKQESPTVECKFLI